MLQVLQRNKKGFTLIELLVVIAIIGILATIVLVSLNTARQKARDARRQSDIRQIGLAMEMYYDDNNSAYWTGTTAPTTLGTFMTTVPEDPQGGAYAWVDNSLNDQAYLICATLEGGGYVYSYQGGTTSADTGSCPTALQ